MCESMRRQSWCKTVHEVNVVAVVRLKRRNIEAAKVKERSAPSRQTDHCVARTDDHWARRIPCGMA
jgi:hypothetical protein